MVSVTQWREARQRSVSTASAGKSSRARDGATVLELQPPTGTKKVKQRVFEVSLPPDKRTALVRHRTAEVLCYILAGRGVVTIGDKPVAVDTGEAVRIPPMAPHCFETVGTVPLHFLRCCAPACSDEDVELLDQSEPTVKVSRPRAKLPPPAIRKPVVVPMPPLAGEKLRAQRKSLGINQQQFWRRIFVTQSAGSRYESGRSIPKPIQLLLRLTYAPAREANSLFARLRKPFVGVPSPKPSILKGATSGNGVVALRKALRLNQIPFWTAVGVTQSGGSRYESGRAFSEAISVLLRLVFSPEPVASALLEKLRSDPPPAAPRR